MSNESSISPGIVVVLMIGVSVLLVAAIGGFVFNLSNELGSPSPANAQASGEFLPQDGTSGGIVKLTYTAGEPVEISNIEIAVRAECEAGVKQARIVNMPAGSGNNIDYPSQVDGADIIDERSLNSLDNDVDGVSNGGALLQGGKYTAGDTIIFRIPKTDCELTAGNDVSIRLIHTPSETVFIDTTLAA